MFNCALFGIDTETTNLSPIDGEPIEISLYRLNTDECKTWCVKPITLDKIQKDALKINGHKLEDILHRTAEGRERYRPATDVLIEIENWMNEDEMPTDQRILLGHNVHFDSDMMVSLWKKCNSEGTYPFNTKYRIDTMTLEFSLDYASQTFGEGYSLRNLCKKYGVKQIRAHSSEDDTRAMVSVYREQLKRLLKSG